MTVAIKQLRLNGKTRQGRTIDYATAINTHGNLVINTVEEVAAHPNHEYRDFETGELIHSVVYVPVEHEGHSTPTRPVIGGWEIHHLDCPQCEADGTVGRMDSFIFAERVHLAAVKGVDIPKEVAP